MLIIEILYSISPLIPVLQFYLLAYHAEDYRGFLLFLLREVWKSGGFARGPYDVSSPLPDVQALNGNGLYFIFWSAYANADDIKKQDQIYPLYIGITGRTFKQRLLEHIDHGVVDKITSGDWPTEKGIVNLKPIVYVVNIPLPVAKFLESVFLSAFDFPMNVEENNKMRGGMQIKKSESVENGYSYFLQHYEIIMSSLKEVQTLVSQDEVSRSVPQIDHYQFKGLQ